MIWKTQPRSSVKGMTAIHAGKGPLVVCLHGVGLRAEAWALQMAALMPHSRVVCPDLPGHGESAALSHKTPTLQDYSDSLVPFLDEGAIVIGHSMGAMIALDLAHRYASLVQGVVALNAIYDRPAAARAVAHARAGQLDAIRPLDPGATLERWFGAQMCEARQACERWLLEMNPAAYATAYRLFASENGPSVASLQALSCPALFMTGAAEPNSTPAMSHSMARLAPKGQAIIIANNAAHMMPMTHAAQVNSTLMDWIRTVPKHGTYMKECL